MSFIAGICCGTEFCLQPCEMQLQRCAQQTASSDTDDVLITGHSCPLCLFTE